MGLFTEAEEFLDITYKGGNQVLCSHCQVNK